MLLCLFLWMECVIPKHRNRTGDANLDIPQCSHACLYFIVCIYDVIQKKSAVFFFFFFLYAIMEDVIC